MKATIVTRVTIDAERTLVFEYLTDLKYHYLWNPNLRKLTPKNKVQLGSTYHATSMVLRIKIVAKNVVTKFVENTEFEIQNTTGTVQYVVNFRLKPQAGKTVLIATTTLSTDSRAHIFTVPILKQLARLELQTDLQSLKIAVENRLR